MHDALREADPGCRIVTVPSATEAVKRLSAGLCDCALIGENTGLYLVRALKLKNITSTGPPFAPQSYCIAVREGDDDLTAALNAGLEAVKRNGQYAQIHERWLQGSRSSSRWAERLARWGAFLAGGAGLLMIVLLIWYGALRGQVNRRTRALRAEIENHEKTTEALRHERDLVKNLVGVSPVAIVVVDADGRITLVNRRAEEVLGLGQRDLKGRFVFDDPGWRLTDYEGNVLREESSPFLTMSRTLKPLSGIRIALEPRDEPRRFFLVNAAPLVAEDRRVAGFVAAVEDVTEKLSVEMHLRQQQKLESIGTLAGGVAHEINNPINGIMNYAQLILDEVGESPENIEAYATEIIQETDRVATIVRDLLQFARHERDEHSPARVEDIIQSTLSLIRTVMRRDQITLEVDVPRDLPQVECRFQQIQQVIMNLLTNARDALNARYEGYHEDKIMRLAARSVIDDEGVWVRITVEDHGGGIAPEIRERIFDPFFTTKPRDQGTGLGLAISHGIVREHDGRLDVESAAAGPTRFHLDLPARGAEV
jgi:PAS domain S-box-containing protein